MLAGTAGWNADRTDVESSRWPAAAARLSDCRVHTSYDGWHGRARALHQVECSFQYDVDTHPYLVKAKVGDMLSIVSGQIDLTRPTVTLGALEAWVKRHPTGTVETIHYDPAHPERISLVGMEDDIKWQTPAGYVRGALVFALLGAGLLLAGRYARRFATRAAA
jgi:hypothetical protein